MSLISFIKDAGEKLFKKSDASSTIAAAPANRPASSDTATAPAPANLADLDAKAGDAIRAYVEQQKLGIENLDVKYEAATEIVTITGRAPSQEAAEKAVLCCGNVANVASVNNQLQVPEGQAAQFHDVVKGDTLSAISKKYYGDATKYNAIFEANRPMLSNPDRIYPGQKLRIPKLT